MLIITLTLTPYNQELAEILVAELSQIGFDSFQTEDPLLKGFIPESDFVEPHLKVILDGYRNGDGSALSYTVERLPETNWNALWEEHFKPVLIPLGKGCSIWPAGRKHALAPRPAVAYPLVLDPDMSFGTGHHPTTRLMIEALLRLEAAKEIKGRRVLDFGCGTGILAILAAKMGASTPVHALDNSARAKEACLDNARRNRVPHKLYTVCGDGAFIQAQRYDIILANINRNLLVDEMGTFARALDTQTPHATGPGHLFLSGFFPQDVPILLQAAKAYGFTKKEERHRQGWAMLHLTK